MKKIILSALFVIGISIMSCSSEECKNCTGCKTLTDATLCEEDFEKTSDYNDLVENYESDGCSCSKK